MNQALVALLARAGDVAAGLSPVPSPCNKVCRLDGATGWCEGCWRSMDEIVAWGSLPEDGKRAVWARLPQRARAQESSR